MEQNPFLSPWKKTLSFCEKTNSYKGKYGLGRILICDTATESLPVRSEISPSWRENIFYLWKVQDALYRFESISVVRSGSAGPQELHSKRDVVNDIGNYFMPQYITVPPTSLLTLFLFGFLILIGPVEYILLRKINKVYLTWFTLPLSAVIFAFLCEYMANAYIGSHAQNDKGLYIIDLDADGQALCCNQIRFFMHAERNTEQKQFSQALIGHFQTRIIRMISSEKFHTYRGNFPQQFSLQQTAEKWSPYLQRIFLPHSPIAVDAPKIKTDNFQEKYSYFYNELQMKSANWFVPDKKMAYVIYGQATYLYQDEVHPLMPSLYSLSVSYQEPFSKASPFTGNALSDLPIYEYTDQENCLLITIHEDQGNVIVYRQIRKLKP